MSGNRAPRQKPCHHCRRRSASAPPGISMIHYEKSWLYRHCSSVQQGDRQAQKAGQLFSGLLAMNVVFLGSAFISSMIFNHEAITLADVWVLLSILKVLCVCWIIYYLLGTRRRLHAVVYRDSHAGPIWIRGNQTSSCTCPNKTICKVFQKGYILLYPFNTEYCLICCSMLYVIWKNVGRRLSHPHIPHVKPNFRLQGVVFGPLLGATSVVIGICVFMIYQIQATGSVPNIQAFVMYYSYYIVLLPVMSVSAVIGTVIHALEKKELDTLKNPTRSLDVILLMGAALGQIGMCYFSIVAIVATNARDLLNSLILSYSVLLILQNITQNVFIIDGLHRQPVTAAAEARHNGRTGQRGSASELPEEAETTASSRQEHTQTSPDKAEEVKEERPQEGHSQRRVSVLELGQEIRKVSLSYIHNYSHLSWKRRVLREISFFLVLCNIILWVMPTFGAHPVFENGLEKSFYGYSTWFAIVNFGLPLSVFYRMHSVGGLVEIYVTA
ncbi:otopetrin-3 [Patagioenas fasciata monilis]|uniref:Otopetrin-3 n=1 Tax=Patagioenas fasciata monilis TaxID=372326 RepID=A0A1V4KVZ4_PATFA|nr:otopetrin-3 [Patagioenas fasciata monilis]